MWDSESHRLGFQQCTPAGYALRITGDWVRLAGFLFLVCTLVYLVYRNSGGTFDRSLLWFLAGPAAAVIVSEFLYRSSKELAIRKNFHYDYERREASWDEDGHRRTYQ